MPSQSCTRLAQATSITLSMNGKTRNTKSADSTRNKTLCVQRPPFTCVGTTPKWWRRVFLYLLMVSVHNSYAVAKDNSRVFARTSWSAPGSTHRGLDL
ncbi:hypothetical protein ElyMa_004696700 [Elysia marginata]|uniref:Secreted protein n=1 Tax=Elysia marginata TaxID=1093978 RepID=A0AAV4IBH0_9GAST|nr:hypothetical protein ElyMa_004696700 [Elysia marginata]